MPQPARWNINGEDSAAIFGALHSREISVDPQRTSVTQLAPVISSWLRSHPSLQVKYAGSNFRNNFGRNFRNVVSRYDNWRQNPSKLLAAVVLVVISGYFVAARILTTSHAFLVLLILASGGRVPADFLRLAGVSIPERNEDRTRGLRERPGSDHGGNDSPSVFSRTSSGDNDSSSGEDTSNNVDDEDTPGRAESQYSPAEDDESEGVEQVSCEWVCLVFAVPSSCFIMLVNLLAFIFTNRLLRVLT